MEESRDRWSSRTAFVLAAIGSAVGLGNIWRFPYVCYANGGGAFFIPYLIALFTAGIPLLVLEFGVGQMMQGSAPAALKKVNPHTEWVGWFALLVSTIIGVYYAVILAWTVQYLWKAFTGFFSHGAMAWSDANLGPGNPAALFFEKTIRNQFENGDQLWQYHWPVILGLFVTWGAVFSIIAFGVKGIGKVVKWTVPLKVLVLAILILRGLTLAGSGDGIRYFLTPHFEALGKADTWLAAYGQIFFSLTIGFGVMMAYASYRPKDSDITNNAFMTALGNCCISFIAGFAVFSVIGFLAHSEGRAVPDVVTGGPGLVFITYPTAISKMGTLGWFVPPLIGVLFFLMLLSMGIDSIFSLVEAVVAALRDRYPWLSQPLLTAAYCGFSLVVGIIFFANRAGLQWLDTFDHWANDYGLAIVGLIECLIIGYFFPTEKLRDYVSRVSEIKLWGWWELCIKLLTPVILIFLLAGKLLGDLGRGRLYGMSADGKSPFDAYVWIPPLVFVSMFVIAFAMSRMWSYLMLIGGGMLVFGVVFALLRDSSQAMSARINTEALSAAVFCGFASAVLIGGLALCLWIASKGGGERGEEDGKDEG